MCGITGYIGDKEAYPIIINGLKRLEYRGYDSAGVMIYDGTEINLTKTKGKVAALETITNKDPKRREGKIGIGHTRWATHGVPNDINSHPHFSKSGNLVIVHNGIIENYDTLRKELISRGYTFQSDTDTEVLVNLIEEVQKQEKCKLGKAVQIALTQVTGAYAIAVFDKKKPNEIVVAKLGSPTLDTDRGFARLWQSDFPMNMDDSIIQGLTIENEEFIKINENFVKYWNDNKQTNKDLIYYLHYLLNKEYFRKVVDGK